MKVCFVCLTINPLLENNNSLKIIGGSELQQLLLAKELIKKEVKVSFITLSEQKYIMKNGFEIYGIDGNINGILSKIIIANNLLKTLKLADADIYYQRVAESTTGIVAFFCNRNKKKFIYNSAHDEDSKNNSKLRSYLSNKLYTYGIKNSVKIIVQNNIQQENFLKNFKKKSIMIQNGISLDDLNPSSYDLKSADVEKLNDNSKNGKDLIWVSTIRKWKQPEIFIEIAKKNPNLNFLMIGGPDLSNKNGLKYYEKIECEAEKVKNLNLKGFVGSEKTDNYIKNSKILVNTSLKEGFPNTFLQAWKYGIPVVSLNVDPDEIIQKNSLGIVAKNFDGLNETIKKLSLNKKLRKEIGKNALTYVKINHDMKIIAEKYYYTFLEVLN